MRAVEPEAEIVAFDVINPKNQQSLLSQKLHGWGDCDRLFFDPKSIERSHTRRSPVRD
jgi:hypothetical protein